MTRPCPTGIGVLLGGLLLASSLPAQGPLELRFVSQPGAASRYDLQLRGQVVWRLPEGSQEQGLEARFIYQETVLRLTGGRLQGEGQVGPAGAAGGAPVAPTFRWLVEMPATGAEPAFPTLKKQSFDNLEALGGLLLFVQPPRLLSFPDAPVAEGGSWRSELVLPATNGRVRVETDTRLLGWEERDGEPVARLEMVFRGDQEFEGVRLGEGRQTRLQGRQTGEMAILFSPRLGRVLQSRGEMKVEWEADAAGANEKLPRGARFELEFSHRLTQPGPAPLD